MLRADDDRAIDWVTRIHRTHRRKTATSGRSRRCKARQDNFVNVDATLDAGDVRRPFHALAQGRRWGDRRAEGRSTLHAKLGR